MCIFVSELQVNQNPMIQKNYHRGILEDLDVNTFGT